MQHPIFDHEKLDVYQVSLDFVAYVVELVAELKGDHRNAKDQLLRSSQSIPLNIAEGNGKRSPAERRRFLEIARGSALESAASLDVLVKVGACQPGQTFRGKEILLRVVSMLTRMTELRGESVREEETAYAAGDEGSADGLE